MKVFTLKSLIIILNFSFLLIIIESKEEKKCNSDIDCPELNFCNLKENICNHKALFPIDKLEIIGYVCIFFASALSNAGGVGGGGLFIPLLILLLKFSTSEAIPISKLIIFSGGISSFFVNVWEKHPNRNAILIDYNIPLIFTPMLLFGTMIGVTLNKVFPSWIILVALSLILIINTYKTFKKGYSLSKEEKQKQKIKEKEEEGNEEINKNKDTKMEKDINIFQDDEEEDNNNIEKNDKIILKNSRLSKFYNKNERLNELEHSNIALGNSINESESHSHYLYIKNLSYFIKFYIILYNFILFSDLIVEKKSSKESNISYYYRENLIDLKNKKDIHSVIGEIDRNTILNKEEAKDNRKFPKEKIGYFLIFYMLMIFINLMKGTKEFKSIINIDSCSLEYWIVYISYMPFGIIGSFLIFTILRKEYNYRCAIGYKYYDDDVKWDKSTLWFPFYGFISGIFAGLLGIGGGLIVGPLLLDMGLNPVVSSATTNILVVLTSSSTSIQFMLFGSMNYEYGLACFFSSSLGAIFGNMLIKRIVKNTKKTSILIYVLGIISLLSTIVIPIQSIFDIIKDIDEGKNIFKFNYPC